MQARQPIGITVSIHLSKTGSSLSYHQIEYLWVDICQLDPGNFHLTCMIHRISYPPNLYQQLHYHATFMYCCPEGAGQVLHRHIYYPRINYIGVLTRSRIPARIRWMKVCFQHAVRSQAASNDRGGIFLTKIYRSNKAKL